MLLSSNTNIYIQFNAEINSEKLLTWKKGLIILHGPHHVAEKSTTISLSPADFSSASNSTYKKKILNTLMIFPLLS